jgi:hypothetical protein
VAIHAALAPGGVFLNLDAAITENPRLNALDVRPLGGPHGRARDPGRRSPRPLRRVGERDGTFPLDDELAALRRAGFAEVECFWAPRRHGHLLRVARRR